jgi:putative endonuclease
MRNFTVYILISKIKSNWSYVGCTSKISQRMKKHQAGKVKSTKAYRPLELKHTEDYATSVEARNRELYLKTGFGREEKKTILNNLNNTK